MTNRNSVPNDPNGAWYTSGVRIGTPALTTRGLGAGEMDEIAELIHTVLTSTSPAPGADGKPSLAKYVLDPSIASKVSHQAAELVGGFPLYPSVHLD